MNLTVIEVILWVISVTSGFIAWEFYKSNGRFAHLKKLMVRLFCAKVWLYGGSAVYFLFQNPGDTVLIRIIIFNLPMFLTMIPLWAYVKGLNK